jgi:hypothetical protein
VFLLEVIDREQVTSARCVNEKSSGQSRSYRADNPVDDVSAMLLPLNTTILKAPLVPQRCGCEDWTYRVHAVIPRDLMTLILVIVEDCKSASSLYIFYTSEQTPLEKKMGEGGRTRAGIATPLRFVCSEWRETLLWGHQCELMFYRTLRTEACEIFGHRIVR